MISIRKTVLILLAFGIYVASAQDLSNIRTKLIKISGDTVLIDSSGIVPNSLEISGLSSADFFVDHTAGILVWKRKPLLAEVFIRYRVLAISVSKPVRRMSFDTVFYRFGMPVVQMSGRNSLQKPLDFGKLTSNGSIGRSLSFGNRQDAVLNSSLNLQLNGYMGDSILINAAISDNNIPIQPDGNTQNLNEFDQVYIQFSKPTWKLSVGDLDIRQNNLYYLNFYKRLQGVSYAASHQFNKNVSHQMLASGAVAKGKFTRNVFQGVEGNQGPYRLKGANQELFFIVLAGTERIFIDGELMQRGEDQDYVINYNTAEITFTPKQMITKDKRIQVEFEYADRNFLNSQLYFNHTTNIGSKLSVTAGYFSNTDASNSPINQTLNASQKQFLSSIGNDITNAFYPSAFPDTFSQGKLLYRMLDTVFNNGKRDTIYIYQPQGGPGLYALSFSELGEGNGDYILDKDRAANGKVYKYVAPDPVTGKKSGSFEPVILLVAPKRQSVFSIAAKWAATENTQMEADAALSIFDPNRFSPVKGQEGNAARIIFRHKRMLQKEKELILKTQAKAEYNSIGFKPVERLRTVEFNRDWGLDLVALPAEEKLISADVQIENKSGSSVEYELGNYARNNDFNAFRNRLQHVISKNGWRVQNLISLTTFEDQIQKGRFFRPVIDLAKKVPSLSNREFSLRYTVENTSTKSNLSGNLTPGSFSFSTFQLSTQSDPEKENKWGLKYFTRADALPLGKELQRVDRSHNFNVNAEWMSDPHHQLRFNTTFRKLDVINNQFNTKEDNALLGRMEYFADVWKSAITGSTLYELGSGQEPRRDFTYFEVPAGQGEYAWIDYNVDGIQQINEFEVARFRDQARFIRIFTPTSEFIRANYLNYNYNLVLNPSEAIGKEEKSIFLNLLKRIYFQSSVQVMNKETSEGTRQWNPFAEKGIDSTLITSEQIQSHSLSFNRLSQVWGIDLNFLRNSNRAFLSYGIETRQLQDLSLRIRSNWFKVITLDLVAKSGKNDLETPGFQNRNYSIKSNSIEPRITFTNGTRFRIQSSYKIDSKKNLSFENARNASWKIESKYNLVSNTSISTRVDFSQIQFSGVPSSTVGYVMLEGLQPGKNFLWTIDLTKRLGSFMEISIQYEGRKSGLSGMVNLGRAQVRALL